MHTPLLHLEITFLTRRASRLKIEYLISNACLRRNYQLILLTIREILAWRWWDRFYHFQKWYQCWFLNCFTDNSYTDIRLPDGCQETYKINAKFPAKCAEWKIDSGLAMAKNTRHRPTCQSVSKRVLLCWSRFCFAREKYTQSIQNDRKIYPHSTQETWVPVSLSQT